MSEEAFPEIDADVVVAEVILLRAESDNAILIVEGSSDEKLLWDYIDHNCCTMVIAEGKANATKAISVVHQDEVQGVVCLVDKDFDDILGVNHANDNVVVTQLHDMEMIVLHSPALTKVLREMGSKAKIKKISDADKTPIMKLLDAACSLGLLRLISLRDKINLKFEGLNFRSYDRKTLAVDKIKLCRDLINNSQSSLAPTDLNERLIQAELENYHHALICCGHDVTTLLGKALQSLFGSKNALLVETAEIESRLRLAYSWTDFLISSVYADIRAWEARNAGYRILIQAA